MPPTQHHTEYAHPVLRAPSPASSVGTVYGVDQTAFSDSENQTSQTAFERKWEERLELGKARKEEELANQGPLLYPRPKTDAEEQALYEKVMRSLRREVHRLEENELFEQTLLRGSQAALEQQPSSNSIDTLMRSMMGLPTNGNTRTYGYANNNTNHTITDGPWNNNGYDHLYEGGRVDPVHGSGTTAGKRSVNMNVKTKGRSRKV